MIVAARYVQRSAVAIVVGGALRWRWHHHMGVATSDIASGTGELGNSRMALSIAPFMMGNRGWYVMGGNRSVKSGWDGLSMVELMGKSRVDGKSKEC